MSLLFLELFPFFLPPSDDRGPFYSSYQSADVNYPSPLLNALTVSFSCRRFLESVLPRGRLPLFSATWPFRILGFSPRQPPPFPLPSRSRSDSLLYLSAPSLLFFEEVIVRPDSSVLLSLDPFFEELPPPSPSLLSDVGVTFSLPPSF